LAILVVAGLCIAYRFYQTRWAPAVQFTTAKWLAYADPRVGHRTAIVDDLLRDYELKGMTSAQIEQLLGPQSQTDMMRGHDRVYWLGPERGWMSLDSEWLLVDFKNGRVSSYELTRD